MKDLGTELLHESTVGTCAFPGDNKANWPPVPKWLYKLDHAHHGPTSDALITARNKEPKWPHRYGMVPSVERMSAFGTK